MSFRLKICYKNYIETKLLLLKLIFFNCFKYFYLIIEFFKYLNFLNFILFFKFNALILEKFNLFKLIL